MIGWCQSKNHTPSKLSSASGGTVEGSVVTQREACHGCKSTFATRTVQLHEYVQQGLLPSVIRGSKFKDRAESVFAATARRAIEHACSVDRKAGVRIAPVIVAASKTMKDCHRPSVRSGAKLENRAGIRSAPACGRAVERSRFIRDQFGKRRPKRRKTLGEPIKRGWL